MSDKNFNQNSPHIDTLIDSFVPSHISDEYPVLIEFVRAYLHFLETQNKSAYYQNTLPQQRFVDTQQEEFLKRIEKEIGLFVPQKYQADPKLFYNKISELWRSRGSEEAIKTFFRIFLDEPVQITYPNEQLLIPSNSVWVQESFITIRADRIVDSIPRNAKVYHRFKDTEVEIDTSRINLLDSTTIRVYTEKPLFENSNIGDEYVLRNKHTDNIVCYGNVIPSPSSLPIKRGGKDWTVGEIVSFPGNVENTIARVDSVDNEGGIENLTIIEYGYDHKSSSLLVSPYFAKPVISDFDINEEVLSSGGIKYTLDLGPEIFITSDEVTGFSEGSYFVSDYVDFLYNGNVSFNNSTKNAKDTSNYLGTANNLNDITLEEWLQSRALLQLTFSPYSKLEGSWKDLSSIISEDFTRVQDNYYYQTYSYEINSPVDPRDYKLLVPEFNVAGQKPFFNYENVIRFDSFALDVSYKVPFFEIEFFEIAEPGSFEIKEVHKPFVDVGVPLEQIYNNLRKPFNHSVTSADNATIYPEKVIEEIQPTDDNITQKQSDKYIDIRRARYADSNYFAEEYILGNVGTTYAANDYFAEDYGITITDVITSTETKNTNRKKITEYYFAENYTNNNDYTFVDENNQVIFTNDSTQILLNGNEVLAA